MFKSKYIVLLLSFVSVVFIQKTFAQEEPAKWAVDGYLKSLQNTWVTNVDEDWITWNTINNRFNIDYYPDDKLSFNAGIRTIADYGQLIQFTSQLYPNWVELQGNDDGFLDLTRVWADGNSYLIKSSMDRLYIDYNVGKVHVRAGRQRINWGMGLVWNPNDIFNSFSYLDFDYEERPGSDALLLEYYPNYTSTMQVVIKADRNGEFTYAGMFRFNKWNYDMQLLTGYSHKDYILGVGWSGDIKGAGFRGELTSFLSESDGNNILVASVDADYTFKNSLYVHSAFLYNSNGKTGNAGNNTNLLFEQELSPKNLSMGRYALFAQATYPLSPLVNLDYSIIYNPLDNSSFMGPSVNVSIADNWSVLLMTQLFIGKDETEYGDYGTGIAYIRTKWSF
jgi:hypothetical protein